MVTMSKRNVAYVFVVICCTALFVASRFIGPQQTWDTLVDPPSAPVLGRAIRSHDGVMNASRKNPSLNVSVADDTRIQELSTPGGIVPELSRPGGMVQELSRPGGMVQELSRPGGMVQDLRAPGGMVLETATLNVTSNTSRIGTDVEVLKTDGLRQESTFPAVEVDYLSALRKTVSAVSLPWWERESLSNCSRSIQNNTGKGKESVIKQVLLNLKQFYNYTLKGHCGIRASLQGSRQKIVSYSLYGSDEGYWRGLPEILEDIKKLYPGWLVRLHTDPREGFDILCPLRRQHPHLYICDVRNLPPPLGNVSHLDPMLWRSSPFGDEQVERFNVRDTDSQVMSREAAAVAEWVKEGKLMHMMRDHPFHTVPVMGGMFGIWQPPNLVGDFERIRRKLFHPSKVNDQINLARVLPYRLFKNSVQHSSFNCIWFRGSRAFPTRREGTAYIGSPVYRTGFNNSGLNKPCPRSCRPPDHKDWEYC